MKIVEIDEVKTPIVLTRKVTWRQKFCRNLYKNNYAKWLEGNPYEERNLQK